MNNKKIIIYDFDGTLTPYSLPRFEILEKSGIKDGMSNPKFLEKAEEIAHIKNINKYEAMYQAYFEIVKNRGFKLTDETLCLGFDNVNYNPGVLELLNNLHKNNIKNYLLSSGMKVFLEKTKVAPYIDDIYATTFNYNEQQEVIDIKSLMTPENKVAAIKDIIKLLGNKKDDCSNVIYIGDGLTDYYAMDFVKQNRGITIFVYQEEKDMEEIKEKDVVTFYALRNFLPNSTLNNYIMNLCCIKN